MTPRTRRRGGHLAASLVLALLALVAAPAIGSAAPAPPAANGASFLRLAHLSPDTPNVDVYLASVSDPALRFTVPGVGYGAVSDYRSLPADTYTVAMRESGAPADSPPVISTTVATEDGAAYTVAGTGRYTDLGLQVLSDDLRMPEAGQSRIRVVNAATSADRVDISVDGGPVIAEELEFAGTTGYRSVPVGAWTLQVGSVGRDDPARVPIDVGANTVYTVFLLDGPDGLSAELYRDSAGAGAVPVGSVATGQGGTAPEATPPATLLPAALLSAGALAVAVGALALRARAHR